MLLQKSYVRHPCEPASWCLNENTNHCTYRVFVHTDPCPTVPPPRNENNRRTSWSLELFDTFIEPSLYFVCFPFFALNLYVKYTHWPFSRYSKPYAHVDIPYVSVQKHPSIVTAKSWRGCINTPVHSLQVDFSVLTSCLCPVQKQHCVDSCTPVQYVWASLAGSVALPVLPSQVRNSINSNFHVFPLTEDERGVMILNSSSTVLYVHVIFKVSSAIQSVVQYPLLSHRKNLAILSKVSLKRPWLSVYSEIIAFPMRELHGGFLRYGKGFSFWIRQSLRHIGALYSSDPFVYPLVYVLSS